MGYEAKETEYSGSKHGNRTYCGPKHDRSVIELTNPESREELLRLEIDPEQWKALDPIVDKLIALAGPRAAEYGPK